MKRIHPSLAHFGKADKMPPAQASYTPKAIRGQQFAGHVKINKRQVEKLFASGQSFTGFIVGNNVNTFHFFGGWYLACKLACSTLEEFSESLNSFLFYLDKELGNNAAIYLKK